MAENPEIYVVVRTDHAGPKTTVRIPLSKHTSTFDCSTCGQTFAKRPYLVRHTKVKHGLEVQSAKESPDVVGKCPACSQRFQKRIDLLYHLANEHKHQITVFDLEFPNSASFAQWFEEIKMQYQTSFASHSAKVLRDGTRTKMYHCNRDVQANGRKTRKVHSRATIDYCTAHLYVRQRVSGEISVLGSPTHMNHEVDPSLITKPNLPMSRTARGYREIIAQKRLPQEYLRTFQKLEAIVKRIQKHLGSKPHEPGAAMTVHNLLLKAKQAM